MTTGRDAHPRFGPHQSQYGPTELAAVWAPAHDAGRPITAHAHDPQGIAGVDGIEHAAFFTPTGIQPDPHTVADPAAAGTITGAVEARLPAGLLAGLGLYACPGRPHHLRIRRGNPVQEITDLLNVHAVVRAGSLLRMCT